MAKQQIIAMGGGGFSMEPDNLALDRYVLEQAGKPDPSIGFLATASGDAPTYIVEFYKAFRGLGCNPSHLSLFEPHTADLERYIMEQDIIYVGGGNTRSMLALWREWELDLILRDALEAGVVLAGVSAGANCWFKSATTDSISGTITAINGLGFLPFSCSPHYDGESQRRPMHHRLLLEGQLTDGFGIDDSAAIHFVDGEIYRAVASVEGAVAYRVTRSGDEVNETALEMTPLLPARA